MKRILFLLNYLIILSCFAQLKTETFDVYEKHGFYNLSDTANSKLIIFLHGGVRNPYFRESSKQIPLNHLIENNVNFLKQAAENGFDLLLPIVDDSLNWLERPQQSFSILKNYLAAIPKFYRQIYIAGFSDGGTGSFIIFYSHPEFFDGLVVFNGYPQHSNFSSKVDYSVIHEKKIVFFGTSEDKRIPYEFLLTEYCAQKKENADTYFYLSSGGHSFNNYEEEDVKKLFHILSDQVKNHQTTPIHGYVENDQPKHVYRFRKKIIKKYNYGEETYHENTKQMKQYKGLVK